MESGAEFVVDESKTLASYRSRLFVEMVILIFFSITFVLFFDPSILGWALISVIFLIFVFDLIQYPSSKKAVKRIRLELAKDRIISHYDGSHALFYKDMEVKKVKFRDGEIEYILLLDKFGGKVRIKNFRKMDQLLLILKEMNVKGAELF